MALPVFNKVWYTDNSHLIWIHRHAQPISDPDHSTILYCGISFLFILTYRLPVEALENAQTNSPHIYIAQCTYTNMYLVYLSRIYEDVDSAWDYEWNSSSSSLVDSWLHIWKETAVAIITCIWVRKHMCVHCLWVCDMRISNSKPPAHWTTTKWECLFLVNWWAI